MPGPGLVSSPLHFVDYLFLSSTDLTRRRGFSRGWAGGENQWIDPLLPVINAGFFFQSLIPGRSRFQALALAPMIFLTLPPPQPHTLPQQSLFIHTLNITQEEILLNVSYLAAFPALRKVLPAAICLGWCFALV